jgi:hypothetical protein
MDFISRCKRNKEGEKKSRAKNDRAIKQRIDDLFLLEAPRNLRDLYSWCVYS